MIRSGNMNKRKSLRFQLLFRFFILFLSLLVILGITQYVTMRGYLLGSKYQLMVSRLRSVERHRLEDITTPDELGDEAPMLIKSMAGNNIAAAIISREGKIIAMSSEEDIRFSLPLLSDKAYEEIIQQRKPPDSYFLVKDESGNEYMLVLSKIGKAEISPGFIQLSTPIRDIREVLDRQLYTYLFISLVVLIIGGIVGRRVLDHTLRPLNNMTDTMEQITVGQLNTRLPLTNAQLEIDRLSRAFNDMLQRIKISFENELLIREKLRRFVSDASHELRTPLTSIHGFTEVLLRGAAKNEKQLDTALYSILTESERLTKLVNDLLTLTRLEQQIPTKMKYERLSDIVKEIYPQLHMLGGKRKINLNLDDEIIVYGNRDQLKQVVLNLVHNAIQHTDERNGIIDISVQNANKDNNLYGVLRISDNGTGIPEEHLDEIYDRFFRSESHRSRKHGGYGLGLSIVKSIVNLHEGEIAVKSVEGKGTEFTVFLRLSPGI